MTERWNVHTNDLGDRCPWSRTEITDDANTCPARCRDAEPDRHLSWKTRGPAPDWGKLGITPGTFSLTDEPTKPRKRRSKPAPPPDDVEPINLDDL